ncbi:MAG: right-handed parallel beta-helix repeat-containing protein [Pseudomonadota bacterium]
MYVDNNPAHIVNNIVRNSSGSQISVNGSGRPLIVYNNIYGGYPGTGNIDADPLFVDMVHGDFHLRPGSPCIDAGINLSLIVDKDTDNENRIMDGDGDGRAFMDMGIDEASGASNFTRPSVVWVNDDWSAASLGDSIDGHIYGYDAFSMLQPGVSSVAIPGTVHVAAGTYYMGVDLRSDVHLRGENPETVIIDGQNVSGPLVTADGVNATAVMEGFTVQNSFGRAIAIFESHLVINRCRFVNNDPGHAASEVCVVAEQSSPTFINTLFHGNNSTALGSYSSQPEIINCVFTNNTSTGFSGGLESYDTPKPLVNNSIFYGNSPIQFSSGRERGTFHFSNIEGGHPGVGNIDENPDFVDIGVLNFNLQPGSSSINSGDPRTDIAKIGDLDLSGNPRMVDSRIDMGIMEYQSPTEEIFFVNKSISGGGGTSWERAFNSLNDAIDSAGPGDKIWVATGTYTPDRCYFSCNNIISPDSIYNAFHLKNGVALYGGFMGGETDVSQRNPELRSILSGDIGVPEDPTDNVLTVIYNHSSLALDETAILDGFQITGGYEQAAFGGGMLNLSASPTIRNCVFSKNHARFGGGMHNRSSSPLIEKCRFEENMAFESGGAIHNDRSSPSIQQSSFVQNAVRADSDFYDPPRGGAIYNQHESSPRIVNTFFSGNQVLDLEGEISGYGGAISTYDNCNVSIVNSSFAENLAAEGAGIASFKSDTSLPSIVEVTNSILWDGAGEIFNEEDHSTLHIRYSAVWGGFGATEDHNIIFNPRFIDDERGDLHLQETSPCINAGNNDDVPIEITTDIDGENRIQLTQVDMGADETQFSASVHHVWVDDDYTDAGSNDGHTWGVNAFSTIQEGIDASASYVYVAPGVYTENIELKSWIKLVGSGPKLTIIDGGGIDSVIKLIALTGEIFISGFTFQNGSAQYGGGLIAEETRFEISNCHFIGNLSEWNGGGIYTADSVARISSCLFKDNQTTYLSSSSGYGGGVASRSGILQIVNSIFTGNSSVNSGGAIYISAAGKAETSIVNCTLVGNKGKEGNGISLEVGHGSPGVTEVSNSILWNGGDEIESDFDLWTIRNSLVSGGFFPGSLVNTIQGADPRFISPETGDFHVDKYSPCVGRGSNSLVPVNVTVDFDGNPRIRELSVDIGAYESDNLLIEDVWVDDDYISGGYNDGHLWGVTAFSTISEAIESVLAKNVRVLPGTYQEMVTMQNGISIIGSGPDQTFIDGNGKNRGVTASQVDMSARLEGITLQNCESEQGGGMFILNSSPTIVNCRFINNHSKTKGGAIYVGYDCAPWIINCLFQKNSTKEDGGAIYCSKSSHPNIYNSVFYNNSAGGSRYGGGIYVDENATPVIIGSTFHDNRALFGGALYVASASPIVTNTILWGNHPDEFYVRGTTSAPVVTYSLIEGGYDGAIPGDQIINADPLFAEPEEGNLHLTAQSPCIDTGSTTVPFIHAVDIDGDARIVDGNRDGRPLVDIGADEYVPQLYLDDDWLGCHNGDAIGDLICGVDGFGDLSVALSAATSPTIIHVAEGTYSQDTIVMKDSVKLIGQNPETTIIVRSGQYGGTIFICNDLSADTVIKGVTIRDGGQGNLSFPSAAVEISNSTLLFDDCIFEENGPIAVNNDNASPRFIDCIFRNNHVGMYNKNDSRPILEKCLFETNEVYGMYNKDSSPDLANCDFINNNTINGLISGGAMHNQSSHPRITDSRFIGNVLDNDNGSITFGSGGAMYNWYSSPEILRCEFVGNGAVSGGAMANIAGSPIISNCLFRNNINTESSDSAGGAIYNHNFSAPQINNSVFTGNTSYRGGAIYYALPNADKLTATIVNSIFSDNSAIDDGGAIYTFVDGLPLHISNSVFYNNLADSDGDIRGSGGGIYNYLADVTVVNSIFWNNGGGQIVNLYDHVAVSVQYSDILGGYGIPEDQNIDADPLFVNPSEKNFSLHPDSPCIDKGTSVSTSIILPELDIDGTARPQGSGYDMGAYELMFTYPRGDLNQDGRVDLQDTIIALRILIMRSPGAQISILADINGDGKISIEEAINALLKAQISDE